MKYEEQELLIVSDVPSRSNAGAGKAIRVVRWRVDGSLGKPGIVKSGYYTYKGEVRFTKKEMLHDVDFSAIKTKWPEIYALFQCPPEFVPTRSFEKQDGER